MFIVSFSEIVKNQKHLKYLSREKVLKNMEYLCVGIFVAFRKIRPILSISTWADMKNRLVNKFNVLLQYDTIYVQYTYETVL